MVSADAGLIWRLYSYVVVSVERLVVLLVTLL